MASVEEHLPQIGLLMEALESAGPGDPESLFWELEQALTILYAGYVQESQFLAPQEPQSETAERIGRCFVEVFSLLRPLGEEIAEGELSLAQETADTLKEVLESLYPLFQLYRRQYDEAPRFSEVPYTHELVRVSRHFLEGNLGRESVVLRLDHFAHYHEHLQFHLENSEPSGAEKEAMRENSEDLQEALRAQAQGMSELEAALSAEEPELESVEGAIELLTTSAEVLVDIYRSLYKADQEPRRLACPMCSRPNELRARTCRNCGAVLPAGAATSDESVSTLALEEDGRPVHAAQPEELRKLQQAVAHFSSTGDLGPLREARSKFSARLARVEKRFAKMSRLDGSLSQEQATLLESVRSDFARALECVREGMEMLAQGEENEDVVSLESGLIRLGEANDIFEALRDSRR